MKTTTKKFGEDVAKTKAAAKKSNAVQSAKALKSKEATVASNAKAEAAATKPRKIVEDTSRTASTLSKTFGGLAGNAESKIRGKKGLGE